jgi:hypothetical protein
VESRSGVSEPGHHLLCCDKEMSSADLVSRIRTSSPPKLPNLESIGQRINSTNRTLKCHTQYFTATAGPLARPARSSIRNRISGDEIPRVRSSSLRNSDCRGEPWRPHMKSTPRIHVHPARLELWEMKPACKSVFEGIYSEKETEFVAVLMREWDIFRMRFDDDE